MAENRTGRPQPQPDSIHARLQKLFLSNLMALQTTLLGSLAPAMIAILNLNDGSDDEAVVAAAEHLHSGWGV